MLLATHFSINKNRKNTSRPSHNKAENTFSSPDRQQVLRQINDRYSAIYIES